MKLFHNLFKGKKTDNIELDDLSLEEGGKIYTKIISSIHKDLKVYGFKKSGKQTSYRIINNVYQSLEFQKSKGNNSFTINTSIRPISWHRPESEYLLASRRVGHYIYNHDKWHIINSEHIENAKILSEKIVHHVLPVFQKLNSTSEIIKNELFIRENKIYDLSVMLYSAIEENIRTKSLDLLNERISELKLIEKYDWAKKDLLHLEKINKLIIEHNWKDVNEVLTENRVNFHKSNPKLK